MPRKEKLVDTKFLCEYFSVTRQAVGLWRRNGMPCEIDKPHGTKRYKLSKVKKWLNRRAVIREKKGISGFGGKQNG